jgi:hypothetical protein
LTGTGVPGCDATPDLALAPTVSFQKAPKLRGQQIKLPDGATISVREQEFA